MIDKEHLLESCADIALEDDILRVLERDIAKQGFAGPANVPKLVYLSLLTGMQSRPVSLLIKGPSGAGKSFSLKMGKQFIPKKAYEEFEGMSEKAIVYLKDMSLKNRHLIIGEAAGMADGAGRALIRQLLSEGKVRYATVENTDQGLRGTELPTLEGPCGLIMTTTATSIHPEDESRMLSIEMHESPDQIAAALMAQAEGVSEEITPIDMAPWYALYEWIKLENAGVEIPFAKKLASRLPTTHDKIKRDFPHLLSLIKASARLHHHTRDVQDGRVIASIEDYRSVYDLANGPLSEGLSKTVPDHIRKLVEAVGAKELGECYADAKSMSKLAEMLDRDIASVSRNVAKAISDGFVENTNPGQGREAKLQIGSRKLPSQSVLPSPDELFADKIAA